MKNAEEKEILETYEKGAAKLESPSNELLKQLADAGENTFKKDKRINIANKAVEMTRDSPASFSYLFLNHNRCGIYKRDCGVRAVLSETTD